MTGLRGDWSAGVARHRRSLRSPHPQSHWPFGKSYRVILVTDDAEVVDFPVDGVFSRPGGDGLLKKMT